jgi:hypothetical protein
VALNSPSTHLEFLLEASTHRLHLGRLELSSFPATFYPVISLGLQSILIDFFPALHQDPLIIQPSDYPKNLSQLGLSEPGFP